MKKKDIHYSVDYMDENGLWQTDALLKLRKHARELKYLLKSQYDKVRIVKVTEEVVS